MKLKIFKFIKLFTCLLCMYSLPILGCLQYFFLLIYKDYLLRIIVYYLAYWKYYTFSSVWKYLSHFIAWILPKAYIFLVFIWSDIFLLDFFHDFPLWCDVKKDFWTATFMSVYIYIFLSAFIVIVHFIILRIFNFFLTLWLLINQL